MASDEWAWPTVPLGSIARFRAGSAFKTEHQGEASGEMPFIKVSDFSLPGNEYEIRAANNWVGREQARSMKAALHPAGATVFAKIGVALTYNRRRLLIRETAIDNNLMSAAPIDGRVSSDYLYFLLCHLDFNQIANGSALPYLNVSDLQRLAVGLPGLREQEAISSTLLSLVRCIDLLRQTNATLESIAQALFKSWFIDFDPVRAKAEGREPEGMDAATAALFPAEFEASALGLIPKGWVTQRLGSFVELAYGKALKATERRAGDVPVYGSGGITGFHDEALVKHPSIIVGRKGTVGSLYWEDRPFFPIDTTFYVKPNGVPLTFCYYGMQRLGLESMNTDAAVPGLNRENAYRLEVVRPSEWVLQAFDQIASGIRDSIRGNGLRAELLSSLRDTLLPRLISGKLRLPEAQEHVEEALG